MTQFGAIKSRIQGLIAHNPLAARLLTGGAWIVTGKGIITVLSTVMNVLLARMLSPDDMGIYVFSVSVIATVSIVARLGLGLTMVRIIASALGANDVLTVHLAIRKMFRVAGINAILVGVLFGLFGRYVGIVDELVWVSAFWMVLLAWQVLLSEIMRGFHDMRAVILLKGSRTGGLIATALSVVGLTVAYVSVGKILLTRAILICAISTLIAVIWAILSVRRRVQALGPLDSQEVPEAIPLVKMSFPILLSDLNTALINQVSIWMTKALMSDSDVALYGAASRLIALTSMELQIVNMVSASSIAELYAQGEYDRLERLQRRLATLSSLPALAIILVLVIWGGFILKITYGDFYRAAAPFLVILSLGYLITIMTGSSAQTLLMSGHQTKVFVVTFISSILTVVLCWVLINAYGGIGAALATSFGLALRSMLMLFVTRRYVGIWTHLTFRRK